MNQAWIALILTAVSGYLLGSINSAILVTRIQGRTDIRRFGSGNAGVTNMLRTYGRKPAALTVGGDLLKAVVAVVLGRLIYQVLAVHPGVDPGHIAGLFVLLGHVFPVYFGFKGGKGVMPAFGIILLVNPPAFLVLLAVAVPAFLRTRIMSLVSVLSAVLYPIVTQAIIWLGFARPSQAVYYALAYSALVLYAHRENIRRLLEGTEKPVASGKSR